jgi:hypothetical protein
MKQLRLLPFVPILAGAVPAQTYDELPAGGWTQKVDEIYDSYLTTRTSYLPLHIQYAYDTSDIPVAGAVLTEAAWHRNNYYSNAMPAGSLTTTVTLSLSPNSPAAMSTTFASNLVNLTAQVFQGTVNFPTAPFQSGVPAPWTHVLKFTNPFIYAKGTNLSLVIDMVTTASTGYTTSTYLIDASGPDAGARTSNPSSSSTCKFSNGNYNNSLSYTTGGLNNNGGTWYVSYGSILPNAPGLVTLSAFGVDNPGSWPIPLDLTGIGAPGCKWNVGFESGIWIPVTASATGSARLPNLTIPPGLGGFAFYDHGFFVDPAANQAGIVVTWSSKWYIGTGKAPSASTLYRTADTSSSPTGTLRAGTGTHVRIAR